jgi:hypothetical protein
MMHFKCLLFVLSSAGYEVLRAVTMKGTVSWILMQCSVEKARRFGGIYYLHL